MRCSFCYCELMKLCAKTYLGVPCCERCYKIKQSAYDIQFETCLPVRKRRQHHDS